MTNKEACSLYRDNLNKSFDILRHLLEECGISEVKKFRLFSRSGIIEGAIFVINKLKNGKYLNLHSGLIGHIINNRKRNFNSVEDVCVDTVSNKFRKIGSAEYLQNYLINRRLDILNQQRFNTLYQLQTVLNSKNQQSPNWRPWL